MKWLNGNKTHLGMIGLGILGLLAAQEIIDAKMAATIGSLLAAWTGVAIRAAYAKGK